MSFFSPSTVDFYTGLGIVVTANTYSHVYGVKEYPGAQSTPLIPCIATGALGNSIFGVQSRVTYTIGDIVFFCYQQNYGANSVAPIGYIIGSAPTDTILTQSENELVQASPWDGDNLTFQEFPLFAYMDTTAQLSPYPLQEVGHGASDMLPGDMEAAGRLVSLLVGDYFAGFRGNCAEMLVSGLDRRLLLRSFLRTESTVNSAKDIAIYNRSTITTEKLTGNVDDAWYDCITEDDTDITAVSEDAEPVYRSIIQSGDILYGKHHTNFSADGSIPLYSDYEGADGTKSVYSAVRLSIGKKPGIKVVHYIGERLNAEDQSGFTPTPEIIGDPLKKLKTSEENWLVSQDDALFALNSYPEEFLDAALGEYPDKDPVEVDDPLCEGGKIKIHPGIGNIDFLEDGSIRIRDAWGSYILMSHGNVEIHAMNNLFMLSARDTLEFAGGNRTIYAENDVSVQARQGDFRQLGGNNVRIQSDKGETIIESKNSIQLMSQELHFDGLYVGITCKNPWKDDSAPGELRVLNANGHIKVYGNTVKINGDQLNLTGASTALVLSSTAALAGTLTVLGGIHCVQKTLKVSVLTANGTLSKETFSPGADQNITVESGGIHAKQYVLVDGLIWASNQIVGSQICTLEKQDKLLPIGAAKHTVKRTVARFQGAPIPDSAVDTDKDSDASEHTTADRSFTFGEPSKGCVYRLTTVLPSTADTSVNTGYLDVNNHEQYIYPGTAFWTRGVNDIVNQQYFGFKDMPKAKPNNK